MTPAGFRLVIWRVALFAIEHAAYRVSLGDLLEVASDHADQPHAQGCGWVPTFIDNTIEVGISHRTNEPNCHVMDGVEVATQQLGIPDLGSDATPNMQSSWLRYRGVPSTAQESGHE